MGRKGVRWAEPVPGEEEQVRRLLPVARAAACRYQELSRRRRRYEDAYADAVVGVLRAVRTYDRAGGASLGSWARRVASTQILDGVREASELTRGQAAAGAGLPARISDLLEERATEEGGAALAKCTALHDRRSEAALEAADAADAVEAVLRHLPERERRVARAYYLRGRTMLQIAREEGCSESRISYLLAEVWPEIRRHARRLLGEAAPC